MTVPASPPRQVLDTMSRIRFIAFDFDGVFTDNRVLVSQDGTESVFCWRGDGLGLSRLRRLGIEMTILSTEANPVVTARATKLGIACTQQCDDKLSVLRAMLAERDLLLEQAAFMGNDINDLACLRAVGLPIVVGDAHPDVVSAAAWRTTLPGGRGAVREVCDAFADVLGASDV